LDFEVTTQYILTVTATDGGTVARSASASVTVNVNDVSDEKPTCTTNLLSVTVNEPGSVNDNVSSPDFVSVYKSFCFNFPVPVDNNFKRNEKVAK
jgi:hypothetical protein